MTTDEARIRLDLRWARALAHPIRVRILHLMQNLTGEVSPAELSRSLEIPLPIVSYHVRRLHALGVLALGRQTATGSSVQHFYRLADRVAAAQAFDHPSLRTHTYLTHLGAALREHREAAGRTLNDIAKTTGVPSATLTRIEQGDADPPVSVILQFASALGVSGPALLNDAHDVTNCSGGPRPHRGTV